MIGPVCPAVRWAGAGPADIASHCTTAYARVPATGVHSFCEAVPQLSLSPLHAVHHLINYSCNTVSPLVDLEGTRDPYTVYLQLVSVVPTINSGYLHGYCGYLK